MNLKPTSVELHNYKKWKSLNVSFPDNGVVAIIGKPDTGKTSFIDAIFRQLTQGSSDNMLTRGTHSGYTEIEWKDANGEKYVIRQDLSVSKDRFLVIMPDGSKKTRIKDISELLAYESFNVDSFINYSYSEDGRRKQRNILLGLLPKEKQDEFFALEYELDQLVKERSAKKRELDAAVSGYDMAIKSLGEQPTDSSLDDLVVRGQELSKLEGDYIGLRDNLIILRDNPNLNLFFDDLAGEVSVTLIKLDAKISVNSDLLSSVRSLYSDLKSYNTTKANIEKSRSEIQSLQSQYNLLDSDIELKRGAKNRLISDAQFPFKNIIVDEDGVWVINDGQRYELKWEQVSTSVLYKAVAEIAIAVSGCHSVVLMDRGESLGRKNLEWLDEIARTNDVLMLVTVVDDTKDEVLFEIINKL